MIELDRDEGCSAGEALVIKPEAMERIAVGGGNIGLSVVECGRDIS